MNVMDKSVFAFLGSVGAGHPLGVLDLQRRLYCCPQQLQVSSQEDRGTAQAHPPLFVRGQPLDGDLCHLVCHLPDPLQLLALRKVDVSVAGTTFICKAFPRKGSTSDHF